MRFKQCAFFAKTRRDYGGIRVRWEFLWERSDALVKIAPLLSYKKMDRSSGEPVLFIIFAFVTGG